MSKNHYFYVFERFLFAAVFFGYTENLPTCRICSSFSKTDFSCQDTVAKQMFFGLKRCLIVFEIQFDDGIDENWIHACVDRSGSAKF